MRGINPFSKVIKPPCVQYHMVESCSRSGTMLLLIVIIIPNQQPNQDELESLVESLRRKADDARRAARQAQGLSVPSSAPDSRGASPKPTGGGFESATNSRLDRYSWIKCTRGFALIYVRIACPNFYNKLPPCIPVLIFIFPICSRHRKAKRCKAKNKGYVSGCTVE